MAGTGPDRTIFNSASRSDKPFDKMPKEDQLASYIDWINNSENWRQPFVQCWETFYALYRHKHPHLKEDCGDQYQINKIFSTVNVILSSTALEFPKITVEPRTSEDTLTALIAEKVVNFFWDVYDYQRPVRTAYKDSIIIGHGWIKTSWAFAEEDDGEERDGPELEAAFTQRRAEVDEEVRLHPSRAASLPTDEEILEEVRRLGHRVTRDEPTVTRVSPFDMFVDPEARDITDVRWIAQRVRYTMDELRELAKPSMKNGGFRKSAVDAASAGDTREDLEHRTMGHVPDQCEPWVVCYEFYDIARSTFCMFTEDGTEFLRDPQAIPYSFGHPYCYVENHEVTEELYGMGDVEPIADLQTELNQTRSDIVNHRKRYRLKHWYREGLGEEFKKAMLSNEEDIWAEIPDDVDADQLIGEIPQAQIPADFYNQSILISQDIDEVSGITDFQRGRAPAGGTATEAAILNSAAQARASEKLRRLERVMSHVASNVIMLAQQFMSADHTVRITGVTEQLSLTGAAPIQQVGQNVFVDVNKELISGEFDFRVEAGSTQPQNEALRVQRAIQMLSILTPFAQTGQINVDALLRWALEQFGIVGVDRWVQQTGGIPGLQQAGTPPGGTPPQTPVQGTDNQIGGQTELPGAINQLNAQVGASL